MKPLTKLLFIFCSSPLLVHADTIYKSVDENGKVTYSQTPPTNAENASEVRIQVPPTDKRIEAAQQRHERNLEAAKILEQNRKKREEIINEENRLRSENQRKLKKQEQQNTDSDKDRRVYPYYYPYPGPPLKPGPRPPVNLPVR